MSSGWKDVEDSALQIRSRWTRGQVQKSINECREVLNHVMISIHACTVFGCQRGHVHTTI